MCDVKLSFCLPVYNQIHLVKKCINSIIKYQGKDIEIIVNDDCSDENIYDLIQYFKDPRIKYFRNNKNLGHDLNIIQTMKKAKSNYAFLLRTRDEVIHDSIKKIISVLYSSNKIVYYTGTARDENGKLKINYQKDRLYKMGISTIIQDMLLYTHPSGSIYYIDNELLNNIEKFLKDNIDTNYSFLTHSLLRIALSQKGNFYISQLNTWIYTNTDKARDQATNSTSTRESVYSYEKQINRYYCLLKWIQKIAFSKNIFTFTFIMIFRKYLKQVTWFSKIRYENKQLQYHYKFDYMNVNISKMRANFLKDTKTYILNNKIELASWGKILIYLFLFENILIDKIKYRFIWH